ncbi:MAG: OmpA family protein [Planctomycetaceae bacterium]|nr:OmpA family protein [Planctomycetaceae bacterium]
MRHAKMISVIVVSLFVALAAGCENKKDAQIKALFRDKQLLTQQKDELSKQLSEAQARQAELQAQADAARGAQDQLAAAQAEARRLQTENETLKARGSQVGERPRDDQMQVGERASVEGDVLFASGKATLSGRSRELDSIVSRLRGASRIQVIGHTDSDPIKKSKWASNYDLSNARAAAVKQYLISRGVSADIETMGVGPDQPVASNSSPTGKRQNRRVEIKVIR